MAKRIEFGEVRLNDISKAHIEDCIRSNWLSQGPKVKLFEQKFADLFGYKYCRATSSGTTADICALLYLYELGAEPGDNVIVPALSFIATANAVRAAGFVPKFVDIKRETLNINEDLIEAAIDERTVGIVAVNTMGRPCELDKIRDIANKHNLYFIVDACESYFSLFHGKLALEFAQAEVISNYTAHLVSGGGEGGAVLTNDKKIADNVESVRSHGREPGSLYFQHDRYGLNCKQSDIHAALLLGEVEKEHFEQVFRLRHKYMTDIREGLRGYEKYAYFSEEDSGNVNCPHGFSITLREDYVQHIDKFKEYLTGKSISWKRNFNNIPRTQAFAYLGDTKEYPEAFYVENAGVHFGCHQYLSSEDISYIIICITNFLDAI